MDTVKLLSAARVEKKLNGMQLNDKNDDDAKTIVHASDMFSLLDSHYKQLKF